MSTDTDPAVLNAVRTAVNTVDPFNLFSHGAPESEYSLEVEELAEEVTAGGDMTLQTVSGVFRRTFNDSMPTHKLNRLVALLDTNLKRIGI